MDPESSPNVAVKPPPLNSDQLNYLIWRYLQEAGYGDAAVKLQRDWKVEPENLPFAKHIKGPALVSLVQKGLRYHHLSLTIDEAGRASRTLDPSMFFFGPEGARPDIEQPLIRQNEVQKSISPMTTNMTIPRKRETDVNSMSDQIVQSTKRSRKPGPSITDRNGTSVRKPSTAISNNESSNAMELDTVNGHAVQPRDLRSPSTNEILHEENATNGMNSDSRMDLDMDAPTSGVTLTDPVMHEQANNIMPPLIHTLTNGDSVGVQVAPAKVANLCPSTSILSATEDPHVTKIGWRPGDKSILTTSGQRTCGIWRLAGSNLRENGHTPTYQKYQIPASQSLVSGFAWQPNGQNLAVATFLNPTVRKGDEESNGSLHTFDDEMTYMESLASPAGPLTTIKSLPSGSCLVGIASDLESTFGQRTSSTITVWNISGNQTAADPKTLTIPETLLDIDTAHGADYGAIYVAGGSTIYHCQVVPELKVENEWTIPTYDGDTWSFIRCSSHSNGSTFVVAAAGDTSRIWLPEIGINRPDAHTAPITGLEIRPRAFRYGSQEHLPEFATASIDGSVRIWQCDMQSKSINMVHMLNMNQFPSIMAISYSPDGFCLAAASYGDVDIWNAEHDYHLMASWQAPESQWAGTTMKEEDTQSRMSSIHGDAAFNGAEHRLAWDTDSKKLAFSLGSQIAIINFQR